MLTRQSRRATTRRGAILLVVLAMLALFAVIALSFVLYAESEATSMRNGRAARNEEAPPNPQEAANDFLGQMAFGTSDNTSAVYGHDFATTKYGWVVGGGQSYSPYSGEGLRNEDVGNLAAPTWTPATIPSLDRRQVVNYTIDAAGFYIRPHLRIDGSTTINKSTPYTYPDRANFYLAMQNPLKGEIIQPSFHRPDLFDPTNNSLGSLWPGNLNWMNDVGRYLTVRPRPREHVNFPLVPANADGTFTGDVQNMRFINGSQKNDSLWMYPGSPIKTWRNKRYVAMVAPLILDLSGRINMSAAGNNRNAGQSASNQGWGSWEVNPSQLGINPTELQQIIAQRYTGTSFTMPVPVPPARRYDTSGTATAISANINGRRLPPPYSRIDADAVGSGAADPMRASTTGEYNPFLVFTTPRFAATQLTFYDDPPNNLPPTVGPPTGELIDHPGTFNPFHWPRGAQTPVGPHGFGMDDLVKMSSRYSDSKQRYASTELSQYAPNSFGSSGVPDTAATLQNRALTTAFSVTQSWAEVQIATGAGVFAKLGPVDLNRPLPDYRMNPAQPYSPSNVDAVTPGSNYSLARAARQRLAMDIFLRLAALVPGLVDGTNIYYIPAAHSLNNIDPTTNPAILPATVVALQRLAQYAANTVDIIDSDDIVTAFVWNPMAPLAPGADPGDAVNFPINAATPVELGKRVVYGTELPRLVINEAYCKLDNSRRDSSDAGNQPTPGIPPTTRPARDDLEKKYWVELHNPLPIDGALPDAYLARLQYVNGGANATPGFTGTTYAVYQVEVAETTAPQPLANHLTGTPSNVLGDPSLVGPTLISKLRVNNYTYDVTPIVPATPPATLMGDELNVVRPTSIATGADASNQGYYVLGPKDQFPTTPPSFKNSMCLADPLPVVAPALPNAMIYSTMTKDPNQPSPKATSSVILQRLANPYLPPQANLTLPNYNPYITVDFLENIPTRDRAEFDATDRRMAPYMKSTEPSIGRRHPYASMPAFDLANPDANFVVQQKLPAANTTSPPHTFFSTNSKVDPMTPGTYIINTGGFADFVHYDRELINSNELLHVSAYSPSQLMAKFSDGVALQQHVGGVYNNPVGTFAASALLNPNYPITPPPGVLNRMYRAFDLLTTANRMPGIPLGGREPGRVNLNTVGDPRVLQAILDARFPRLGNSFDPALVTNAWTNTVLKTRTPNWSTPMAPYIRATSDETTTPNPDRPFKLAGSSPTYEDTLFRSQAPPPGPPIYPYPMLFNPDPAIIPPYMQEEPHRKAWNNLTTVSDGFLVIWTVGFFEVEGVTGAGPTIGKELFDKVPGDLRAQYSAVVDRSMLQVPQAPATGTNGPKPWETKLMADAPIGSTTITVEGTFVSATSMTIYNDGVAVDVVPDTPVVGSPTLRPLRLGYGNSLPVGGPATSGGDGEWVRTQSYAAGPTVGTVIVTLDTASDTVNYPGVRRFHGSSSRVGNTLPGNPGPQPTFDASNPANRHLVPYFTRMEP